MNKVYFLLSVFTIPNVEYKGVLALEDSDKQLFSELLKNQEIELCQKFLDKIFEKYLKNEMEFIAKLSPFTRKDEIYCGITLIPPFTLQIGIKKNFSLNLTNILDDNKTKNYKNIITF